MKGSRATKLFVSADPDEPLATAEPATVLLVRHAHVDAIGTRLVGRLPGIGLSATGAAEVEQLRARLVHEEISAIYSSPLERAMATARPLGLDHGLDVLEE